MLYITGENENLNSLMQKEGYEGFFADYSKALSDRNPHLQLNNASASLTLPAYVPVILVTEPPLPDRESVVREINNFSLNERKTLREMQGAGYDLLSQIIMQDVMEELQEYSAKFRTYYDDPLITTPWKMFNQSLTNASMPDILAEMSIYGAQKLNGSGRMFFLDTLYENLMKRDDLNRRLHLLKGQSGQKATFLRNNLETQVKDLTREIKRGLNAKINSKLPKYLSSYGEEEIRKMKMGSYSKKVVRKEQLIATRLDLLNRSGLSSLRKVISRLKVLGEKVAKFSTALGVAAVTYDVGSAYYHGDSVSRAFLAGTAGIGTSMLLASSGSLATLGTATMQSALLIGGLTGEAALSVGALLCTPAGVIVVTIVGAAVVGYASYKASEYVGELWDEYGNQVCDKVSSVANLVYEEITTAWRTGSQWILDFYGASLRTRSKS